MPSAAAAEKTHTLLTRPLHVSSSVTTVSGKTQSGPDVLREKRKDLLTWFVLARLAQSRAGQDKGGSILSVAGPFAERYVVGPGQEALRVVSLPTPHYEVA